VQAIGRQPQRAPDGAPIHYECHRPQQTTLYRLVRQHAATFSAQAEDAACADLPHFVKDEFDAFVACGILAHGFLRLRCGDGVHDNLLAISCKRRGLCPSYGARHMAQTAAHLVDHIIPFASASLLANRRPCDGPERGSVVQQELQDDAGDDGRKHLVAARLQPVIAARAIIPTPTILGIGDPRRANGRGRYDVDPGD
jgi:Transposase zinc-binding domain